MPGCRGATARTWTSVSQGSLKTLRGCGILGMAPRAWRSPPRIFTRSPGRTRSCSSGKAPVRLTPLRWRSKSEPWTLITWSTRQMRLIARKMAHPSCFSSTAQKARPCQAPTWTWRCRPPSGERWFGRLNRGRTGGTCLRSWSIKRGVNRPTSIPFCSILRPKFWPTPSTTCFGAAACRWTSTSRGTWTGRFGSGNSVTER